MKSSSDDRHWALAAGEIDDFTQSQVNKERDHFYRLVNMMENEYEKIHSQTRLGSVKVDLIEVFCSENSCLTEQVN